MVKTPEESFIANVGELVMDHNDKVLNYSSCVL